MCDNHQFIFSDGCILEITVSKAINKEKCYKAVIKCNINVGTAAVLQDRTLSNDLCSDTAFSNKVKSRRSKYTLLTLGMADCGKCSKDPVAI